MQQQQKPSVRTLVYTPAEASTAYVEYAERLTQDAGIKWGVNALDNTTIPMRPGDVIGIIARPGHGKSSLAAYITRKTAKDIAAANDTKRCAVYVTLEQSVEEIETFFQIDAGQYSVTDLAFGRVDAALIKSSALRRIAQPIWLIGKSMARRKATLRMTIDNIYKALRSIEDDFDGMRPAIVAIDYIQIVPSTGRSERVEQVGEAIIGSKELALDIGCPFIICVQASRKVDGYGSKVPAANDCQWASAIEQVCDKQFGIWRPALTEDSKKLLDVAGIAKPLPVTQNLLIVKKLKERFNAAGNVYALHFAPEYIKLADLELREQYAND